MHPRVDEGLGWDPESGRLEEAVGRETDGSPVVRLHDPRRF